jgi:hypothetical protein
LTAGAGAGKLVGMAPRMSTGFGGSDAKDDFDRARRRQTLARAAATVSGRTRSDAGGLVPLAEVEAALGGRLSERHLGLRTVPIDNVIGSVDRTEGFDRRFLPTSSKSRSRWERIAQAARRGDTLPPVELYKLGDAYFVIDGHHRVSVARALGRPDVDARVTELRTRTPAEGLSITDVTAMAQPPRPRPRPRPRRRPPPTGGG